jgi:4-amino-4-deoxychorismate lyase
LIHHIFITISPMVFFESIRITDGLLQNIFYHNERFNRTRKEIFGVDKKTDLRDLIAVPINMSTGEVKCRVFYGHQVEGIEFDFYILRGISSLKLVVDDEINYGLKYANRTKINELFSQRGNCDDVLIIKDGFVTDTSSANVALSDGKVWITPANPLLKGTKRQFYIDSKQVTEKIIRPGEISDYEELSLINAMLELGRITLKTENIGF